MAVARRLRRRGWMNAAKRAAPPVQQRPVIDPASLRARPAMPVPRARAFIFDVEGTLVDSVLPTLHSWCDTLAEFGFPFHTADLHQYSGLSGEDLLLHLLPREQVREMKDWILSKQEHRFRTELLPQIHAFTGVRDLFQALRAGGNKLALATTCHPEELVHYRKCMNVDDLVDVVVTGGEVKRGKPHPDLLLAALKRLGMTNAGEAVAVGDTPYDAEAAHGARMRSVGMLSGLFPRADLLGAGCTAIYLDPRSLLDALVSR
jgi:HAD superfamily hydrolase (TIGR01509 family)